MKIGLFVALLVLLASTNVFGLDSEGDTPSRLDTEPTPLDLDNTGPRSGNRVDELSGVEGDRETLSHDKDTATPRSDVGLEEPRSETRLKAAPPRKETSATKIQATLIDGEGEKKPVVVSRLSENTVHVSGSVFLLKYDSSAIGSVQYDLNGIHLQSGAPSSLETRSPFSQEFIARGSRVVLYVSTTKTTDRKLAFAQFPIKYVEDHFPLSFSVDIDLPSQQRGLLERADITLYFFAYITNPESRIDTFIPFGTSQILLQGTNRLVQKLVVNVHASGVEVSGLFRGRFGNQYITSGTSLQVYIIPEQSLSLIHKGVFPSVAQITITNVPAMFPVPWSLLVEQQVLKSNIKYYAIAFVNERDNRYLLPQKPVLVINEQKMLVLPQVIFAVIPSPFIIKGQITRSMPEFFVIQPHSSLIIRLQEIGSDSSDIIFKLPKLVTLPQYFQLNISEATRFDPLKNYNIRAFVTDEKNKIYMASLQPIPITDELTRLTIPVDDLLYYIHARLQSSSNVELRYLPGSSVQAFVTDTPETPTQPITAVRFDLIRSDFRDFSIQVPATAIQRDRNYYLVMVIESHGVMTHVSKTLLISNNQPPPLVVQLPVLSLNLITGVIYDIDNRPAQWSSSSFAEIYLLDDKIANPDDAIVQVWKIHLENDFPVRFQIRVDFSRLHADRLYRLQSSIENGRNTLEYKPAGSVLALTPGKALIQDVRVPVKNVKTFQLVNGLIYINDIRGSLPVKGEIRVQLSSSPSLTQPSIIDEIRIKTDGRSLPIEFAMNLPLNKININSVYYFLIRYTVNDTIVIPVSQAYAFLPRTEATVVITLSKTPQIPITGQVTATGGPLSLPLGSTLYLYITDNIRSSKPLIYSETTLAAALNSIYEFNMYIDSVTVQRQVPLYLVAEVRFDGKVILTMPKPALLQLTPGGEWNINLVIDMPTLLVGKIVSLGTREELKGEYDVFIEILKGGTTTIVHTVRLRLSANLPQDFRVELTNELFIKYKKLEARALIKNCREQILFQSSGSVEIHTGLNVKVDLTVALVDRSKLTELITIDQTAQTNIGSWRVSITGVDTHNKFEVVQVTDHVIKVRT